MIRLFVPDSLLAGAAVQPAADQAHYLTHVMRRSVGDEILLFNGRDGEWRAKLTTIVKRGCTLEVAVQTRPQTTGPNLELIVALVKRTRLETIVEKAAELGAARVRLAITQFTNADHANTARLQAIAVEAAEQTGRLDVPEVAAPVKLGRMLDDWDGRALIFCDEAGDAPPVLAALSSPPATNGGGAAAQSAAMVGGSEVHARPSHRAESPLIAPPPAGTDKIAGAAAILIGPEGGFSLEERARLRALPFVVPVSLGPRILRADTAAIAALTLWQAATGDWR
jgi:16S rRNA (uracil1498-N3)-methyltransferase